MGWGVGSKLIIFEPNDLLRLMTHYTDGAIPLDSEVLNVAQSQFIERWIQLMVRSKEWETGEPLHFRYEGNKTMAWTKDGTPIDWNPQNETPRRQ